MSRSIAANKKPSTKASIVAGRPARRKGRPVPSLPAVAVPALPDSAREDKIARILDASLETFSEFSFAEATTGEIARRARVSKRDLYAFFPNKHALLLGVLARVMIRRDEEFAARLTRSEALPTVPERLEAIARALVQEQFSLPLRAVTRLVASEALTEPLIGNLHFESTIGSRSRLLAEVLARHVASPAATPLAEAAGHFLSLVCFLPAAAALSSAEDSWGPDRTRSHAKKAVSCFLNSYPQFRPG